MELQQQIKEIKYNFMCFRNGIVSDALRNSGMPYKIIFGLQLPQIADIAHGIRPDRELARALWDDHTVRESRLLACYLFPIDTVDEQTAYALASSVMTVEEADILAFRLLRRLPFADSLARRLLSEESPVVAYAGRALLRNLEALRS